MPGLQGEQKEHKDAVRLKNLCHEVEGGGMIDLGIVEDQHTLLGRGMGCMTGRRLGCKKYMNVSMFPALLRKNSISLRPSEDSAANTLWRTPCMFRAMIVTRFPLRSMWQRAL